jgi:hypothetical protein
MMAKWLWIAGSAIFLLLGIIHFYYTFFTNKFLPGNKSRLAETKYSKYSSLQLTQKTPLWKAWAGFNASHSTGALFFGLVNIMLATEYFSVLQHSAVLVAHNILVPVAYLLLAKKHWLNIPYAGVLIAAGCFIAGTLSMT